MVGSFKEPIYNMRAERLNPCKECEKSYSALAFGVALMGKIKLAIFDMDGVLVDARSSWALVHDHYGVDNTHSLKEFLAGEIDYLEFMRRDISLWKRSGPVHISTLDEIFKNATLIEGSAECVAALQRMGVTTAIVSTGIRQLANHAQETLGVDYCFANQLIADADGYLTGEGTMEVDLKDKGVPVRRLQEELGISPEECVSVGNSTYDVSMFKACGLGIAFNPEDEGVIEGSDVTVAGKNLLDILQYFD